MRKTNLIVLMVAVLLGGVLLFQLGASAQTDACTQCNEALVDCQFNCDVGYAQCTSDDSDNYAKIYCALDRAFCMNTCESTWHSCRSSSCNLGGGGGGGNPTGKDPACVNQCYQFEQQCYEGNPLDQGTIYSSCINDGGDPQSCCNQERDYCIDNCPPRYQP